jgi:hypothetical protein
MGYSTDFEGKFTIDKPVDDETYKLLRGLATTRRMKRRVDSKYGVDGEFYVEDLEDFGQKHTPDIIDYNTPPSTQPGLWCQWLIQKDKQTIEWDGGEKFYNYVEWIKYIINRILKPRGYIVNGRVEWYGEDRNDGGVIVVNNNAVSVRQAVVVYKEM